MMLAALLAALSFSQTPAPAATSRLSGRVTAEGTNAPVAGARVMVFPMMRAAMPPSGPMAIPPQAMTDQDGRFVFNSVAPGEYRIDVQKTGFASLMDPSTRPRTYTVAAGQALDNVSIVLQKGAVISGKVLDQKGEPVTDARLMALRRITPPGGSAALPRLIPTPTQGPQQTNDIGEYRVTGLPPGEYFLAAVTDFDQTDLPRMAQGESDSPTCLVLRRVWGCQRSGPTQNMSSWYPGHGFLSLRISLDCRQ